MCLPDFQEFKKVSEDEAITGYRNWRIYIKNSDALLSESQDHIWDKRIEGPHEVRDFNSGIYAYNNYYNDYHYYYNYYNYNRRIMASKVNKKRESPSLENKAEIILSPVIIDDEIAQVSDVPETAKEVYAPNRARVIKAHDGLQEGMYLTASEKNIDLMVQNGYWERIKK